MESDITIGLRRQMIEELNDRLAEFGFSNYHRILQVMSEVPRHKLAPIGFETLAYEIQPLLIDEDQTMSSPLTVAVQTFLLNPDSESRILEIGTGSGYQASVLGKICKEVYTLERHKILYEKAKEHFKTFQYTNIFSYLKDGFEGLENKAPFDKIIITCGAAEIPKSLLAQLKIGGDMLIPLSQNEDRFIQRIIKLSESEYYEERFDGFQFVPMLKGINQ